MEEYIHSAEIVIYSDKGGRSLLSLSPKQLAVTLKVLGYMEHGDEYEIFSEDTLDLIMRGAFNPFREIYKTNVK